MTHLLRNALIALLVSVPLCMAAQSNNTKWRDIHKVKRHETIFGIAREYDLTVQELIDANPEMKEKGYELKKGTDIFIPYGKNSQPANTVTAQKPEKRVDDENQSQAIKVGVMLPLLDHSSEGVRMVEYYRGVRAALDSLGAMGIKTEVNLWNLNKDSVVSTVLAHNPSIAQQDVIFGPLYTTQVKPLADFCRKNNVKLVIPFSTTATDVSSNPNVYQIYQSEESLTGRSIGAFVERFAKTHRAVFINCNPSGDGQYSFTKALRETLEGQGVKVELTNINTPMKDFAKHFSETQPNVVVLNASGYKPLERTFEKLDSLKKIYPSTIISTYGYNEWFIYQPNLEKDFFKYNVHIPTTYYFSRTSNRTMAFTRAYRIQYGQDMNPDCLPRMALMGFDHTMYFVLGLDHYGKDYAGTEKQNTEYKPLQNRLEFKHLAKGGYINDNFQLIRFKTNGTMDSLTY